MVLPTTPITIPRQAFTEGFLVLRRTKSLQNLSNSPIDKYEMDPFYVVHRMKENSSVTIETQNDVVEGYLLVIDPETGNMIIQNKNVVTLLCPENIDSVQCSEARHLHLSPLAPSERKASIQHSLPCQTLLEGFRKRLISAVVTLKDGEKCISLFKGVAVVFPPYGLDAVYSQNENVLFRVRAMISDIMKDHGLEFP